MVFWPIWPLRVDARSCRLAAPEDASALLFPISKPFFAIMLPRKHRLTADKDVTRVLRQGRAVFTNLVAIKAVANDLGYARVAVVVSTKVHKRAVERNLIKRRLRAVLTTIIPKLTVGVDMVVMGQNEAVGRTQADLGAAVEYCLNKLRLI